MADAIEDKLKEIEGLKFDKELEAERLDSTLDEDEKRKIRVTIFGINRKILTARKELYELREKNNTKWAKIKRGTKTGFKKAGGAVAGVGKATAWTAKKSWSGAKAVGRGGKAVGRSGKAAGDWVGGNILGNDRVKMEFLVGLAIGVHLIDFFGFGFRISWGSFFYRMVGYLVLSIVAYMILKPPFGEGVREFFIVSSIPVFLIPLLDQGIKLTGIPEIYPDTLSSVFLALPVWVIYLVYMKGLNYPFWSVWETITNFIAPIAWTKFYFFVLFIAVLVTLLSQSADLVSANNRLQTVGIDPGPAVDGLTELIHKGYDKFMKGTTSFFGSVPIAYNQMWNDSLGSYHSGKVEENADKTGVFIENFKTSGKYYEDIPITFFPIYKVRSFDQEIKMKVWCEAFDQRNKTNIVNATTDVDELLMRLEDQQGITCEFNTNPENTLTAGRYKVIAQAKFTFETWAYTNYIFMERNFVNSIRANGENINKKFKIDKKPVTIYTSGPLMMGMNKNVDLPFSIDYERKTKIPVGITIDNLQKSKGDLLNVNKFELRVPNEFKLNDQLCTRKVTGPVVDQEAENYVIYTFENPRKDLLQSFVTVDCSLEIDGADAQRLISNSGGITQASMIGTVEYNYLLKKALYLNILANPINAGGQS